MSVCQPWNSSTSTSSPGIAQRRDPERPSRPSAAAVAGHDADPLEAAQHVELGDHDGVKPVEPDGVAAGNRVEPAAAARPAR